MRIRLADWQVDGLTGRCRVRAIVPLYPCTPPPPPAYRCTPLSCPSLPSAGGAELGSQGSKVPLSRRSRPPSLPGLLAVPSRSLHAFDRPLDWTPPGIPLTTADHLLGIYPPVTSPLPLAGRTQVAQDFIHAFFISLQPSSPRLLSLDSLDSLPSLHLLFPLSSILVSFLQSSYWTQALLSLSSLLHRAPFLISPLLPPPQQHQRRHCSLTRHLTFTLNLTHHNNITVEATGFVIRAYSHMTSFLPWDSSTAHFC